MLVVVNYAITSLFTVAALIYALKIRYLLGESRNTYIWQSFFVLLSANLFTVINKMLAILELPCINVIYVDTVFPLIIGVLFFVTLGETYIEFKRLIEKYEVEKIDEI